MNQNRASTSFLRKLHVYGGLVLSFYVIALGISSLQFQHRFVEFQPGKKVVSWEQSIDLPHIEDKGLLKAAIRDSLQLNGYLPWWKEYTDSTGIYHFMISRPGKQYWVTIPEAYNRVLVEESRMPFLSVVFALHPLTGGFNGPGFAKIWRIIPEIMSVFLLVIIVLSIQQWYAQSFSKKRSWIIVSALTSISILLIFLVWLVG
jgi:hypothetical protein